MEFPLFMEFSLLPVENLSDIESICFAILFLLFLQ